MSTSQDRRFAGTHAGHRFRSAGMVCHVRFHQWTLRCERTYGLFSGQRYDGENRRSLSKSAARRSQSHISLARLGRYRHGDQAGSQTGTGNDRHGVHAGCRGNRPLHARIGDWWERTGSPDYRRKLFSQVLSGGPCVIDRCNPWQGIFAAASCRRDRARGRSLFQCGHPEPCVRPISVTAPRARASDFTVCGRAGIDGRSGAGTNRQS